MPVARRFSPARRLQLATLVGLILVWEGVAASGLLYRGVVPSIAAIAAALAGFLGDPRFWFNFSVTAMEIGAAILIGGGAGLATGLVLGGNRFLGAMFRPYLLGLASTPKIILLPILYLMLGIGPASKIAVGSFACFVPVTLSVAAGMTEISPVLLRVGRSFDLRWWQMAKKIYLPALIDPIATGLSIGFGSAVVVCLVAEIKFSRAGLGIMVIDSYNHSRFAEVYAVLAVIIAIAVAGKKAVDYLSPRSRPQLEG
jgi:ABC-type nitrate/sulfonate/bicarbonate transport system permease component